MSRTLSNSVAGPCTCQSGSHLTSARHCSSGLPLSMASKFWAMIGSTGQGGSFPCRQTPKDYNLTMASRRLRWQWGRAAAAPQGLQGSLLGCASRWGRGSQGRVLTAPAALARTAPGVCRQPTQLLRCKHHMVRHPNRPHLGNFVLCCCVHLSYLPCVVQSGLQHFLLLGQQGGLGLAGLRHCTQGCLAVHCDLLHKLRGWPPVRDGKDKST